MESAFHYSKTLVMESPVLTYPDPVKPYILDTDASNKLTGAVLLQMVNDKERVVAYYSNALECRSRTCNPQQKLNSWH